MLHKIILTIAFFLLPYSLVFATQNSLPIIGGSLLPGTDPSVQTAISQQTGTQGEKELNWLQTVFLKNIINKLIGWTAALSVVFVIIGGYQYLTAVGSDDQIKTAHKTITWSLVGVALSLLAFAIVQIVINLKFAGSGTVANTSISQNSSTNTQPSSTSSSISPSLPASPATATTSLPGGQPCGSGKGVCKNYGTGWTGCSAGYETYTPGNADCRSERCCAPTQ